MDNFSNIDPSMDMIDIRKVDNHWNLFDNQDDNWVNMQMKMDKSEHWLEEEEKTTITIIIYFSFYLKKFLFLKVLEYWFREFDKRWQLKAIHMFSFSYLKFFFSLSLFHVDRLIEKSNEEKIN